MFSAIVGGYDAIKSGNLDPKKLATDVAVGTGAGAVSGVVEHNASKLVERGIGTIERQVASKAVSSEAAAGVGSLARSAASRLGGAGIAGAVVNSGFAAVDQIQAYQRGEVTGSQAIGTVAGEAVVGAGAGVAGAAAGAAIGSIVPGAGTVVGAVVGFAVGCAADKLMRAGGVDKAVAGAVTAGIDEGKKLVQDAGEVVSKGIDEGKKVLGSITGAAKKLFSW
jgi:hypothetical protein